MFAPSLSIANSRACFWRHTWVQSIKKCSKNCRSPCSYHELHSVAKITSQNTGHFRWRSNVFQQILLTSMKKIYFSFNPPKVVKFHYLDCSLTQKERVALQILEAPKQVHILIKFSDQTVEEFSNEILCYFLRIVGKLVCSVVFQTLFKRMLFCECFLPCELTVIAENLIIFF